MLLHASYCTLYRCFNGTHEDDAITVEVGVMHEQTASALRNRDHYCIIRVCALKHAKCVLNVLFLVADFQPSRCVETYSRAVLHASDRNGDDLVSHSATITVSNQTGLKLYNIYVMHT